MGLSTTIATAVTAAMAIMEVSRIFFLCQCGFLRLILVGVGGHGNIHVNVGKGGDSSGDGGLPFAIGHMLGMHAGHQQHHNNMMGNMMMMNAMQGMHGGGLGGQGGGFPPQQQPGFPPQQPGAPPQQHPGVPSHHADGSHHDSHHGSAPPAAQDPPHGSDHHESKHSSHGPSPEDIAEASKAPPGSDHHEAALKDTRDYGWAAGLFFIAGVPLIVWGAATDLINKSKFSYIFMYG